MKKGMGTGVKMAGMAMAFFMGLSWATTVMAESPEESTVTEAAAAANVTEAAPPPKINFSQAVEQYKKMEPLLKNREAWEAYMRIVKAMSQKQ